MTPPTSPARACSGGRLPGLRQREQRAVCVPQVALQAGGAPQLCWARCGRRLRTARRPAGALLSPPHHARRLTPACRCPPTPCQATRRASMPQTDPSSAPCAGAPAPKSCWPPTAWAPSSCLSSPAAAAHEQSQFYACARILLAALACDCPPLPPSWAPNIHSHNGTPVAHPCLLRPLPHPSLAPCWPPLPCSSLLACPRASLLCAGSRAKRHTLPAPLAFFLKGFHCVLSVINYKMDPCPRPGSAPTCSAASGQGCTRWRPRPCGRPVALPPNLRPAWP